MSSPINVKYFSWKLLACINGREYIFKAVIAFFVNATESKLRTISQLIWLTRSFFIVVERRSNMYFAGEKWEEVGHTCSNYILKIKF